MTQKIRHITRSHKTRLFIITVSALALSACSLDVPFIPGI